MKFLPTGRIDWPYLLSRLILLTLGALLSAIGVTIFLAPSDIAPSGMTGIGVILHELTGISVALVVLIGNIPIQVIGFRVLKGWRTLVETVYAIVLYSALIDLIPRLVPVSNNGLTDDAMLNALFGGVIGGIGGGLVYRAGGTLGGTSTLARVMRRKFGMSMQSSTIYTDTLVILAAGVVIGWEQALYATIALFVNRVAADYVLEESSSTATVLIVTKRSPVVARAIQEEMRYPVTTWKAGQPDSEDASRMVMVTINRPEVNILRKLLRAAEPDAFVTVLKGQVAFGKDFKPIQPQLPLQLDEVEEDIELDLEYIEALREGEPEEAIEEA